MTRKILRRGDVKPLRDPRYATLWELGGTTTGLKALSAAFVKVDPGAASPRHWHERTEEMYLITTGEGVMHMDGEDLPVAAGDGISIPIGVVHAIANPGSRPLTMWVVTSPPYAEEDDYEVEG
jgi:mannose-6-phosphate isomerase-like protein (cupin superfamily)